jgi:hypothetical protein
LFGVEEVVTNRSSAAGPPAIADDKIEDKHPVYDPDLVITETFDHCEVTLNKSGSVTKLDVLPWGSEGSLNKIFPTRAAALDALGNRPVMPSMEIINGALKPFDDGLYAAVELGAEDGSDGSLIAKATLFKDLLAELVTRATSGTAAEQPLARAAAAQIGAATLAGGGSPALPSGIASEAQALLKAFEVDSISARPIGFYTWSPELSGIFQRDRFLQSPPSVQPTFGVFAATALAIGAAPTVAERYGAALDLYAGLTNPYFDLPPTAMTALVPDAAALTNLSSLESTFASQHPEMQGTALCAAHLAFLPASDSPETRLFRDLYCAAAIPPEQNLIDVLIDRIRSGTIDLTPTATSGWYDRQLYALETLLVPDRAPEKDHLFLTKRYKEKLVETFKSLITQRRETHVKQLQIGGSDEGSGEASVVDVYPQLPVEPFPTFYLRTARAYRFLQGILLASMGQAFLDQSARVLEDGSRSQTKPLDPLAIAPRLGVGYATGVRTSTSLLLAGGIASYRVTRGFEPYAGVTFANHWIVQPPPDVELAQDESLASRSYAGDGLVQLNAGFELRTRGGVGTFFEYGVWLPAQNDPGDSYAFVTTHVFAIGLHVFVPRGSEFSP